jgi:hypothetical protein
MGSSSQRTLSPRFAIIRGAVLPISTYQLVR